jgi:hypothetical protein
LPVGLIVTGLTVAFVAPKAKGGVMNDQSVSELRE